MMRNAAAAIVALGLCGSAVPVAAAAPIPHLAIDSFARDLSHAEDIRAIKTLQRTYAQYAQFGLWSQMAGLFAEDARWIFDTTIVRGRPAIARHLLADGHDGLAPGAVNVMLIEAPLITLSADGRSAQGRWHGLDLLADGKGHASIHGGIYENDYVKQGGVWKIATLHFYPQYAGPYEEGWVNWQGQDLPIVPYHFTPDTAGVPIPLPTGPAPRSAATPASLQQRIQALTDENAVRNLQNAYGYYGDRKMWDDVVDLFAARSAIEIGGIGVYEGKAGVRRALERMGPAGLRHGELNDRPLFDTIVTIAPGGGEAHARGIELGMLGDADAGEAMWEVNVFDNRFVKEAGVWKIREMRLFPLLRADYRKGWGKSRLAGTMPKGRLAPQRGVPAGDQGRPGEIIPAFLGRNPVTGAAVTAPAGSRIVATAPLTGAIAPAPSRGPVKLIELNRRLAVALAYDGVENVSTAYGDYLDDFQSPSFSALLATSGFKVSAFAGYYVGRDRVTQAGLIVWGTPPTLRAGISYHWRIQPVIRIAADGRSAGFQARLFQPRTSKTPAKPYAFYGAGFHSGMYHDQMVLENGVWRFWNLSLDEPYMVSPDWKGGWSSAKDRPADPRPPSILMARYPPDVPIKALGPRMEHFRGGTGETIEWPGILPMWFDYRNPVSGRVPDHYTPLCVPCDARPDLALSAHGYLEPPTGPESDPVLDAVHRRRRGR